MARKYRVKQKADKFYPQYKFLFWWENFVGQFQPRHGALYLRGSMYFYDFKKASEVIQKDKKNRFEKTTIIK